VTGGRVRHWVRDFLLCKFIKNLPLPDKKKQNSRNRDFLFQSQLRLLYLYAINYLHELIYFKN